MKIFVAKCILLCLCFTLSCSKDNEQTQLSVKKSGKPEKTSIEKRTAVKRTNKEKDNKNEISDIVVDLVKVEKSEALQGYGKGALIKIFKDGSVKLVKIKIETSDGKGKLLIDKKEKQDLTKYSIKSPKFINQLKEIATRPKGQSISEAFVFVAADKDAKYKVFQSLLMLCAAPNWKIFIYKIAFIVKQNGLKGYRQIKSYLPIDVGFQFDQFSDKEELKLGIVNDNTGVNDWIIAPEDSSIRFYSIHTKKFNGDKQKAFSELSKMIKKGIEFIDQKIELIPQNTIPIEAIVKTFEAINIAQEDLPVKKRKIITFKAQLPD